MPSRAHAAVPDVASRALPRSRIEQVVARLPDQTSWNEAMQYLSINARVEQGEAELDAGLGIPQEEVERRLLGKTLPRRGRKT